MENRRGFISRSEPLILTKKGKVKHLWAAQTAGNDPWVLIVVDPSGNRRAKKFADYREAKKAIKKLQVTHPDSEYTIVSRQVGYGPPRSKVSDEALLEMNIRGRWWCPFCRKFRVFDWDPWWEKNRCPVCGIPDSNWHVIRNNPRLELTEW